MLTVLWHRNIVLRTNIPNWNFQRWLVFWKNRFDWVSLFLKLAVINLILWTKNNLWIKGNRKQTYKENSQWLVSSKVEWSNSNPDILSSNSSHAHWKLMSYMQTFIQSCMCCITLSSVLPRWRCWRPNSLPVDEIINSQNGGKTIEDFNNVRLLSLQCLHTHKSWNVYWIQ